jgi:hypothetical protein
MIYIEECREDGDGELLSLYCEGWVDKAEFRDACTRWLDDWGYAPGMDTQQWSNIWRNSGFDPRRPELLAAPEPKHIEHLRWRLVPDCVLETGRRCASDCDCQLYYVECKPRGPGRRYTVWSVDDARRRHYDSKREADSG